MSRNPSDSFLPSGAMEVPHRGFGPSKGDAATPRTMPDYIPSPTISNESPKPYLRSSASPPSPPKTRTGSADDSSAALIENWRGYTKNLRDQYEGERKHMLADRARSDEMMDEERALWDEERKILSDKIKQLEAQLEQISRQGSGHNSQALSRSSSQRRTFTSIVPMSASLASPGSIDGTAAKAVPQESGRNPDGSAFYAPAPQHPTRTFETTDDNLRVDSMTTARESAIRVTSKELTPSDFIQSPHSELASIPETSIESIDISLIQPELEGVSIKASAVDPTFAAKVLSPSNSSSPSAMVSPDVKPPPRDVTNLQRSSSDKKPSTLEVMTAPENRRLTMHAGHTPNHSISKFPLLADSGNSTPIQAQHPDDVSMAIDGTNDEEQLDDSSVFGLDDDPALAGKLGLNPQQNAEDLDFITALQEKLEEVQKSGSVSPITGAAIESQVMRTRDSLGLKLSTLLDAVHGKENEETIESPLKEDEKDDGPPLKLKPSNNFGRPMGHI